MAPRQPDVVPCFLCDSDLEVRMTKKDKPYVVCEHCGMQIFVRGPEGIELFEQLVEEQHQQRARR